MMILNNPIDLFNIMVDFLEQVSASLIDRGQYQHSYKVECV